MWMRGKPRGRGPDVAAAALGAAVAARGFGAAIGAAEAARGFGAALGVSLFAALGGGFGPFCSAGFCSAGFVALAGTRRADRVPDVAAVEDLILAPADYDAIDAIKAPQGRR